MSNGNPDTACYKQKRDEGQNEQKIKKAGGIVVDAIGYKERRDKGYHHPG